jgi:hypothetical protein
MAEAFAVVGILTVASAYAARPLAYPSPELCFSIADVGVGGLFALAAGRARDVAPIRRGPLEPRLEPINGSITLLIAIGIKTSAT